MTGRRYRSYGPWLRSRFGGRVQKLTVDGGFTCPNRDGLTGWGGCIYCDNNSFRGYGTAAEKPVEFQIREGVEYLSRRFRSDRFLLYWQNFTSTYAPVEVLAGKFGAALEADPRIVGMVVGTRPDCVEDEKLDLLRSLCRDRYLCIELGMESSCDQSLQRINRGHDFACFQNAADRIRGAGIDLCVHVILGLPWESRDLWMSYPGILAEAGARFVKWHHLHVVAGTALAREYGKNPFPTFSEREWIELVCDLIERMNPEIVNQRLFGWAPLQSLVAPRWTSTRAALILSIEAELERRQTWQGRLAGFPAFPWTRLC